MYLIKTPEIKDPKINLAIEEFAVRNLDISKDYLFIYSNSPSVIIGKNQNPFEEVNITFSNEKNIEIVRRISGGGAVYHENGNINFSFITENTKENFNNYKIFLNPIIKLLNRLGVPAKINHRNDIIVEGKKISGNAQFTSRNRLLSHGTLLFDANLQNVSKTLSSAINNIQSKSTKSVRSKVTNISEFLKKAIPVTDFRNSLADEILKAFSFEGYVEFNQIQWAEINGLAENKFNTWKWNWGRTPGFNVNIEDQKFEFKAILEIKNGLVVQIDYLDCPIQIRKILNGLQNLRFSKKEIENHIFQKPNQLNTKEKQKLINTIFPY
ncbi:MAG: lipoate--protein ligase [Calditrichaeota bacterium]|nr:lipoate--protein ligase [Calditrichota bacterium]